MPGSQDEEAAASPSPGGNSGSGGAGVSGGSPGAGQRFALPSGRQYTIELGDVRAVVTEIGAGLRELTAGGSPLVWPYGTDEMAGGGRGQVLAPWPNRIEDGRYTFGGRSAEAAINEPAANNAIHGLVRWLNWQCTRHDRSVVTMSCVLAPQPAYPWALELSLEYSLGADGLVVETTVENLCVEVAPVGLGFHPYVDCGEAGVDACSLTLAAERRLVADVRSIPRSVEAVAGTRFDFGRGASLNGVQLDDCFTGLGAMKGMPPGAAWEAVVTRPHGRVGVWGDESFGYAMCFTGDTLPPADRRRAIAIEPMTCPPNAFCSGEALHALRPGERFQARYGIRPID